MSCRKPSQFGNKIGVRRNDYTLDDMKKTTIVVEHGALSGC